MTALSLELMDITRECVPPLWCFCQAFTATDFSCCLWVFLPLVLSSESEIQCSIRLQMNQEIDLAIAEYSTFSPSRVAFAVCFGYIWRPIGFMKRRPFAAFGWIWSESKSLCTSEFIRLLLSSVTSSVHISNHSASPGICSYHHTMFHRWSMLWIMSFVLPVILVQVDLNFSRSKNAFQK